MIERLTKVAEHCDLLKDDEGWFLRLHAKDGSYCTLATFPSRDEAEAVWRAIHAVMVDDEGYKRDAREKLDAILQPLRWKGGSA